MKHYRNEGHPWSNNDITWLRQYCWGRLYRNDRYARTKEFWSPLWSGKEMKEKARNVAGYFGRSPKAILTKVHQLKLHLRKAW